MSDSQSIVAITTSGGSNMHSVSLDDILEMDEHELHEYIKRECDNRGIDFDPDMLDGSGKEALYDYIADNLEPQWQAELHSECQLTPGCNMFPNTDSQEELDEELEHLASRD